MKAPPKVTRPAFSPTQKISAVSESVIAPATTSPSGRERRRQRLGPPQPGAAVDPELVEQAAAEQDDDEAGVGEQGQREAGDGDQGERQVGDEVAG